MADFYQIDPGLQGSTLIQKLNFILRQIFKRLDSTDSTKGPVKFYNKIDMQDSAIIDGPPGQNSVPDTDFITAGYLKTKAAGQAILGTGLFTAPSASSGGGSGGGAVNTTAPLTGGGVPPITIAIPQASGAVDGYLSQADWTIFNGKVSTTRQIATSAPLSGGGDLSGDRTIAIQKADSSHDGYLAQGDFIAFNGKQAALGYTPEDVAKKGAASGYAPLDANKKVPVTNLPGGYVTQAIGGVTTITVTHNFGKYPAVTIIDASGNEVIPKSIQHTSTSSVTITFAVAFTGMAIVQVGIG